MNTCSPGSWDELLARLRAEVAAAEAGDWPAVTALCAGAWVDGPPPDASTAVAAVELQERLAMRLGHRLEHLGRRIADLTAARQAQARASAVPPQLLDVRQ